MIFGSRKRTAELEARLACLEQRFEKLKDLHNQLSDYVCSPEVMTLSEAIKKLESKTDEAASVFERWEQSFAKIKEFFASQENEEAEPWKESLRNDTEFDNDRSDLK